MDLTNARVVPKNADGPGLVGRGEVAFDRRIVGVFLPRESDRPGHFGGELRMEPGSRPFLIAGDVVINPALLAFASVETDSEGIQLRLGFSGPGSLAVREIELRGLEARSMLRWLRSHAEFLDAGSSTGRSGSVSGRSAQPGCSPHFRGARTP